MATFDFNARTFFDTSTGAWSGRSFGASFPVTDGESDAVFDLGDTLTFGANTGTYIGTMTYLGTAYPVLQSASTVTILGLTATAAQLPDTDSFTVVAEDYAPCFLAGTRIDTPDGPRRIETLAPGDRVLTAEGRAVALRWVGRRAVSTRFGLATRLLPVQLAAGALGEGVPRRDLRVTADHGIIIDGVICHAAALVNGRTITRVPPAQFGDRYTVYHLETEVQEVILAEGCPAETFVDNMGRQAFDNHAEHAARFGPDPAPVQDLPLPRAQTARQLPASIRARLAASSAA
ncbi:Hint domain-containing protein [Mesobacterium pallidum]|uniref:Hint domain-containing protein n=1 Tax=Mesobacterium pallidum TaxID=2872037 RepID=UPI001EE21896|nr:Hint domain-containing protein [Mesobacterium pallidum]